MTQIHEYNKNHYLLKIKIKDLLNMNVANWEHNRPPDLLRCNEIVKQLMTTSNYTDWLFYMVYENQTYKMIDGIHRLTALSLLRTRQEEQLMECGGDNKLPFGGGVGVGDETAEHNIPENISAVAKPNNEIFNDLYNKSVIVSLRINPTMGEIVDLYQSINKSISIPNIYFNSAFENQDKKNIIEETVKLWMKRFPSHFTHSNRPNVPNTNRDGFIELLDTIYDNIPFKTRDHLLIKLNEMNEYIKTNPPPFKKNMETPIKKCEQSGCWLFLIKKEFLLEIF